MEAARMNMKVKTTLIIIATLIIGIIFGALLSRAYLHHRIRRAFVMVDPNRFMPFFEQIISPTPEQNEQIRKIIQKHTKQVQELRNNFEAGMASSFESLRKELDSILTSEQKERLEKMMRERRPWMRRDMPPFPRRKGPFPKPRQKSPPEKKLPQSFLAYLQ
jgi:Spy/CpxP family protein refolding chaperone